MHILAFGTYDARSHPRVGVLIDGLRAHGHDVDECNAPLGIPTAARVALLRQPWRLPLLALRLASRWTLLALRSHRGPSPDVVVVGYLGHFDVLLARVLFPRTPLVLDQLVFAADTAADRGVATGVRARLLQTLDAVACRAADLVVVDTEENSALAPKGTHTLVVPVGAPRAWYASRAGRNGSDRGPLTVVFFGLFTPLQGAVTIAAAARLLDERSVRVTMVGTGQQQVEARAAAGSACVRWLDWVPAEELPDFVAEYDVCLGIFGTTSKARRVVPNKVFQGAAAGCVLVTSDTAPQRRTLGDAAVFVPAGDAASLADVLTELAADPARRADLAARAGNLAETSFTPRAVTAPLAGALAGIRTRRAP